EGAGQGALEGVRAVARDLDAVAPAFERGAHVMQDVRLVVHHEDVQRLRLAPWRGRRLRPHGWHADGQLYREARAAPRTAVQRDATPVLLQNALADRQPEAGALPFRLGREERLEHPRGDVLGDPGPRV